MSARAGVCAVAALALAPQMLIAQPAGRKRDIPRVLLGNAVIGSVTAAVRARLAHKDVGSATVLGALGGALHGVGKSRGSEHGVASVSIAAVGTSIVSNAGRGKSPLDELHLPLGFLRFRFESRSDHKFRIALNAYEAVVVANEWTRRGNRLDWGLSTRAGTFVFVAPGRVSYSGGPADGLNVGSVIVLSPYALNAAQTLQHEAVHVQQGWYLQEAWGRPVEEAMRTRVRLLRWIPKWLELGVVSPALFEMETIAFGLEGPMRRWREAEANLLQGAATNRFDAGTSNTRGRAFARRYLR